MTLNGKNTLVGMLIFVLSLVIYVKTLCPTVYIGDNGELITASYCLGVAHPPGYPLYTTLGKIFTFLPFGSVAFRVNFMSAFFASLAAVLVYFIILHIAAGIRISSTSLSPWVFHSLAAATGALMLAFSGEFWSGAVAAEVFSLNAFFLALLILVLLKWNGKRDSYIYLLGFIFGLSFTNHITIVLALPGIIYYILVKINQRKEFVLTIYVKKEQGFTNVNIVVNISVKNI